jgi:hypothetical protein
VVFLSPPPPAECEHAESFLSSPVREPAAR